MWWRIWPALESNISQCVNRWLVQLHRIRCHLCNRLVIHSWTSCINNCRHRLVQLGKYHATASYSEESMNVLLDSTNTQDSPQKHNLLIEFACLSYLTLSPAVMHIATPQSPVTRIQFSQPTNWQTRISAGKILSGMHIAQLRLLAVLEASSSWKPNIGCSALQH